MTRTKAFVVFELMNAMLFTAQAAKARGLAVIAVNGGELNGSGPFAVPDGLVDEVVPVASWSDGPALTPRLKDLAERYDVAGTYCMFEAALPAQARLREIAGLPTTGAGLLNRILDKGFVRSRLRQKGLSALASAPLDAALEWDGWRFRGPAVLKPVNGTGSALCYEVASIAELREAAAQARDTVVADPLMRDYIAAGGGFVLEEKAEGELLSAESVVHRGQVRFVTLTGRYQLAADPVVEQGMQTPYFHPHLERIAARSEAVHRCLGFRHGGTHLEFIVADDGTPELVDFNPRPGGFAFPVAVGEAYGTDFAEVLVDIGCGEEPDLSFTERTPRFASEQVLLPPPGTTEFRSIGFPEDVVLPRATKTPGTKLSGRAEQIGHVGMFIATGDTASQAHERALETRRAVVVNGEPLGDNPYNAVTHSPYIGRDLPVVRPRGGQR